MNELHKESSPYLLQHKDNPVNWKAWDESHFETAKKERKLVLVSIGYSSCHWCHVMEEESFEDQTVADIMNHYFVCIKVDREEHPEVDAYYMDAVSLMTGRGGWPLNAICLPDGRPVFGGTYFPKNQWTKVCKEVGTKYRTAKKQFREYAQKLREGMEKYNEIPLPETDFAKASVQTSLSAAVESMKSQFDGVYGGKIGSPKFPMPDVYRFLLDYGILTKNQAAKKHAHQTFQAMATRGIYDQIGGGFARYSTDDEWKVPHFEKMLYDNAQLIAAYSLAFRDEPNPLYEKVVAETFAFLKREMVHEQHTAFFAALDADSEGEEGKFYVWTKAEMKAVLGEQADFAIACFDIDDEAFWENGKNVLLNIKSKKNLCQEFELSEADFDAKYAEIKEKLRTAREKRVRPGLDHKVLTNWNALLVIGLCEAYHAFGKKLYADTAKSIADFILSHLWKEGKLYHTFQGGKAKILGIFEDYAFFINALLHAYQLDFNPKYFEAACTLTEVANQKFKQKDRPFYHAAMPTAQEIVPPKVEVADNVTPSANAVMAENLWMIGQLNGAVAMTAQCKEMLQSMLPQATKQPYFHAKWCQILLKNAFSAYEVAFVGEDFLNFYQKWQKRHYHPSVLFAGSAQAESSPKILKNRYQAGKSLIYVCKDQACSQPQTEVEAAQNEIQSEIA